MAVKNSDELREAQAAMQPKVVELGSRISQSEQIYNAMKAVAEAGGLDGGQTRAVEGGVLDSELGGVALQGEAKARFNVIQQRLAELSTSFSNNVLDATKAYELVVTDAAMMEGVPASTLALAAQNAGGDATAEAGPWKLTLDMPILMPVMQHASNRSLRETLYRVNISKASSGEHDNQPLIDEILALRAEMAGMLGHGSYADISTAQKMAQLGLGCIVALHHRSSTLYRIR
jgi:oligopeptidase A